MVLDGKKVRSILTLTDHLDAKVLSCCAMAKLSVQWESVMAKHNA